MTPLEKDLDAALCAAAQEIAKPGSSRIALALAGGQVGAIRANAALGERVALSVVAPGLAQKRTKMSSSGEIEFSTEAGTTRPTGSTKNAP